MKIAVAPGDFTACGFYRLIQPYGLLGSLPGFDVSFFVDSRDPIILTADVLVLQRSSTPQAIRYIENVRKRTQVRIIVDHDDHLHALPPSNPLYSMHRTGMPANVYLERALAMADAWTTATHNLAQASEYRSRAKRVEVLENAVDDAMLDEFEAAAPSECARTFHVNGEIRIGYAGSDTHEADLRTIVPELAKVLRAYPTAKFVVFGYADLRPIIALFPRDVWERIESFGVQLPPRCHPSRGIAYARPHAHQYYANLVKMHVDIMLAPLESTTFGNAKSALKVLENGIAGYPVVAARTFGSAGPGPYTRYAAEGERLIITAAEGEWVNALSALIEDGGFRERMVVANRAHIRAHHTVSKRLPKYVDLLRSLV